MRVQARPGTGWKHLSETPRGDESHRNRVPTSIVSRRPTPSACVRSQTSARARPSSRSRSSELAVASSLLALSASPMLGCVDQVKALVQQPALEAADRRPTRALGDELAGVGDHAHFAQEGRGEAELHAARGDFCGAAGGVLVLQGVQQHHQQVRRVAFVEQRVDRRVGGEAAVPVVLAVDLHRVVQGGQAGRGQYGCFAELGGAEQTDLAGAHGGGGDEELERARAADALEVELRAHHVAQRVEVEGVELVRREHAREPEHHVHRRGEAAVSRGIEVVQQLQVEGNAVADGRPETVERGACAIRAARGPALGERHGIHRPGAGAADALDGNARLEQAVEHAPGVGAMRATALQREGEGGGSVFRG